jgi:hypothetical protein
MILTQFFNHYGKLVYLSIQAYMQTALADEIRKRPSTDDHNLVHDKSVIQQGTLSLALSARTVIYDLFADIQRLV